ncbi:MAG TPA: ABC transporter permease [Candidatus Bathyarchaeia archaeon]|nr:ABC transporter permease [Candidatus Bathyarchaeia archaeon]
MRLHSNPWLRAMYGRLWVRTKSIYGEPLWVAINVGFPFFTSFSFTMVYRAYGLGSYAGFAILGGVMVSFWGNVLWSMASQFNWDKQVGLFEVYITSPAPLTAVLVGMSLGGILGTAPSAAMVALFGWVIFSPSIHPSWPAVVLIFTLTLASLYAMGMALSALYLAYGREADSVNEALHEPVSLISGVYFPSVGGISPFPFAVQAAASAIPLTIGMDALRQSLGFPILNPFLPLYLEAVILAIMAAVLLFASSKTLQLLENKGRKTGTISVRQR